MLCRAMRASGDYRIIWNQPRGKESDMVSPLPPAHEPDAIRNMRQVLTVNFAASTSFIQTVGA